MTVSRTSKARDWRIVGVAAAVSVLTMPLTAIWFLPIGGVLLVAGLVPRVRSSRADIGAVALVGLGLLVGPAIYISLAAIQ